ncbi:MAG: hypothetical protein ACI815_002022 [Psychroserpens sp.]|jgi:hypothetical protein
MKRSKFFLLSLAGLATVAIPSYYVWKNRNEKKNPLYEPRILSTILEPSEIVEMGRMYCGQFPNTGMEEKLQDYFKENVDTENGNLESILKQQVKKDYQTGNTIILDGWILSETEAVQCALFSISESNQF